MSPRLNKCCTDLDFSGAVLAKKRLVELYLPEDLVEITFDGERWIPAKVLSHSPPGMWVQANAGSVWFVTNTLHVRLPQKGDV